MYQMKRYALHQKTKAVMSLNYIKDKIKQIPYSIFYILHFFATLWLTHPSHGTAGEENGCF